MRFVILALGFMWLGLGFDGPVAEAQAPADDVRAGFEQAIEASKSNMMGDPSRAYQLAVDAQAQAAARVDGAVDVVTAQWLQGEALIRMSRPLDAAPVIDEALAVAEIETPNAKIYGDLLSARAAAAGMVGDYATALASLQSAHEVFLALGESRSRAMALQNIASIYTDARDYQRALNYYEKAGEAYEGDPPIDMTRFNNIGAAYKEMGEYMKAEQGFRNALAIADEMQSPMLESRILANIARVQLADGRLNLADETARSGLALSANDGALGWEPFLRGIRGEIAFARGNLEVAGRLIDSTFEGEDLTATVMPFREFHEAAHKIHEALGDHELALQHLEAFKRLDDEARNVSAAANTALMGAQFDFATQELQIANLRTSTLEQEVALERSRARQRMVLFVAAGLLAAVLLVGGGVHYQSMRRSRNEVRDANANLSQSNTKLARALAAKSEFLATTSHEIRTPLNGILGMTQILMQLKTLPADVRERVELVHGSGETMKAIVDDILDVAKMETGVITVEESEFDLRKTLEGVSQVWRDSASEKGVLLSADFDICPRHIRSDAQRIRQIVFNLLSNAVKFTDKGEVSIKASAMRNCETPAFVIEVRDTGCGIPEEEFEAIFEAFHQLDGGTTRKHGGTGLGLSICRKVAQALGGDVSVDSVMGEGSVFTLRLPLDEVRVPMSQPRLVTDTRTQGGPPILIIDGNPLRQSITEAMLDDCDCPIVIADDAAEALSIMESEAPRSVLLMIDSLSEETSAAMEEALAICDAVGDARLVAVMAGATQIEPAMLRLSGADEVLEGAFNAMSAVSVLLNNEEVLAENSENKSTG